MIEGLENMKSLKVLNLANNLIQDIKHLRTLSYNSKLEEIDVSSNPLNDNIEVKFLLKNLIPSIKFINEAPLKVDPNIYGYTQTLPNQLHHLHQQRGSVDALDSASVSTYPQRPFYQVKSHEAVENDEEGEEESLSWNQGLPAESLLPVMQGKQPQINHHPSMMHYFQPAPTQPSHFNLPPPSMSRDIMTNQPEQLDSPPSSLRNHSNDTINLQSSNLPNNNTPAPQMRKSRLPWRKPPNPLPRNWDQMQQSVIGSNSKKKLVQSPEEPPPQVSPPPPPAVTQPPLMSLMMQEPPSQSFPSSYPFNHYQSNGWESNVSQFPEFQNPVNTMNTSMYDMSYMVPAPPPLPFETIGAFSQSHALNHHYGAPPPFHPALEEMSTSTIPPPLESTRSSRWLSPQLSQRHRSTSPDEGKRLKSYIALPFPDVLATAKKSSAPSSPSNSPNHRNSGRRHHHQQRSSVSPMSASGRQNRYEKSPEKRKAYELSQANVKRLEKQENLPAFIAMTERQKELLDDIRSTQEAARSTTASVNGKERKQSPFDRLNKQKIGNTRRATSTSPTADSGGYGAKFRLKTGTVVSKPGNLSRRPRDEKESHIETETTPNLALIPLDKKIITDYEKRHPTPKKFSSSTSRGRERGGVNKNKPQQKKEGKDQEESKEKTKMNQENKEEKNNNNEESKDKKEEGEGGVGGEGGGGSGGKEEASPYQRFLRLKERINVRYDRDLKKIYDDFHLTEEQVQHLLAATTGAKKVLPMTYQYLPSFEEEIEQAIEGPNHKSRPTGIPQTHSHNTTSLTSSTPLTVAGGGGRMRTPSLVSYNSTMMSLDSLQGTAVSPPPYLLSSIAAVNPTLSLPHNPTPVTSLEQEAFKLSQEIESLKMKKLHEITTNHSMNNIPYIQPYHSSQPSPSPTLATIASEPILPSSSTSHQNQIYDPRRYSSDDYMNKYNPLQVFNQVTNNQQRSLEYHLSFIQDMLHQKKPPSNHHNRGMTAQNNMNEGGGNGSNKENSDDFSSNSGKFVFPSLALYENSPASRILAYPTPTTTMMMMSTPMTNVTSKQSQASPTNSLIRELPTLSEEKTSNPEEVMKFIDRSFDHLHSENLNFQEMQQAIESLKQQQLISLQRIQRQ